MTEPRKQTIIVNYQTSEDRNTFMAENADTLADFRIVWVRNNEVAGVRVDYMPNDISTELWQPQPVTGEQY
jgi:hypothetical protein